mgnify:CR=1 FL=1
MLFKNKKLNKILKITLYSIWVIIAIIISFLGIIFAKDISIFNKVSINENTGLAELIEDIKKEDELEFDDLWKDETIEVKEIIKNNTNKSKINILVVWRWGWKHEAPNLTDTIMLASIDTNLRIISLFSIPRDLYVEYPWKNIEDWKINWLYAKYRFNSGSSKVWMNILKKKVSQITWEKIDFFVNIDFAWFTKLIDTIWWVNIVIPKNFVDTKYPDWNWWYRTLIFKKWTWLFDWENSLKYARSRHSTSDFDRSARQQQVIKAVKDKLTGSYFLKSPSKIKELYDVFKKYVYTDIPLSVVIKLAYNLNSDWDFTFLSSTLNDSCFYWSDTCSKWWLLYTPQREFFWWMSVLLAEWTNIDDLNNYSNLRKYTGLVFNYPNIYLENYKINIFNSLRINNLAWTLSNNIIKYGFNIPVKNSIWNTDKKFTKSIIYYNNIDSKSSTLKVLRKFFSWKLIKTNTPIYSKDNANIEIIIWEDYLWDNNPFKF